MFTFFGDFINFELFLHIQLFSFSFTLFHKNDKFFIFSLKFAGNSFSIDVFEHTFALLVLSLVRFGILAYSKMFESDVLGLQIDNYIPVSLHGKSVPNFFTTFILLGLYTWHDRDNELIFQYWIIFLFKSFFYLSITFFLLSDTSSYAKRLGLFTIVNQEMVLIRS